MLIAVDYNPTPEQRRADDIEESKRLANIERSNRQAILRAEADKRFQRAWG